MNKKIAVVGAGAIGSSVSADLTKAGLDVTVIDQWPAQVEKLKADGLIVRMPDLEVRTPIRALHLCELASANLEFDIVLLAVKSNDHRWLTELIKPYLKADGVLVPVQNGFNDDSIASIIGRERVIGCALELSAEIFTPGEVKRNTTHKTTWFGVGELDGFYTPRLKEIESILASWVSAMSMPPKCPACSKCRSPSARNRLRSATPWACAWNRFSACAPMKSPAPARKY